MSFACLPWYDLAELRDATDALWERVAGYLEAAGVAGVPGRLNRAVHYESQWGSGELLLGQACGYDVALAFSDQLRIVAAPEFDLDGCVGAHYRSFVVVREDADVSSIQDLRDLRCVINTPTSHSGMNVLRSLVAPLAHKGRFFSSVHVSGAHELSLEELRNDVADVAAIDCITYGLLQRVRPAALHGTRVVHSTVAVAAPPFVTSASTPEDVLEILRAALDQAMPAEELALAGVVPATLRDYEPIVRSAREARRLGYAELSIS